MIAVAVAAALLASSPGPDSPSTPRPARVLPLSSRWLAQRAKPPVPPRSATSRIPTPKIPTATTETGGTKSIDYAKRAKKGKFSFEFSKAEILDIVKAISDMTRRNFIIPDAIKSKRITILSPTKITAEEAYRAFLSALAVNDITIVRAGKFYKLVTSKNAAKSTIPTCIGPDETCPSYSEQMVTTILHVNYVDVNQINAIAKNLASPAAQVTIFAPSNALIISEYAPNLKRVRRIIEALDQPGFDDELKIVQIKFATAAEIADKLTQIFEVQARGAAGGHAAGKTAMRKPRPGKQPGAHGGTAEKASDIQISKIIADDRTNQLIIKANRRSFEAIQKLIASLDVPVTGDGSVHVYYLENADAEDLASTLSSLAQGNAGHKPPPRAQAAKARAARRAAAGSAVLFQGEVKVTADKGTNALIIMASGEDYLAMRALIDKLDTPRRQVYIEAAILEVTVTNKDEFGLNWHAPTRFSKKDIGSQLGGAGTIGFVQSSQGEGGISPTISALADPTGLLAVAGGSLAGVIGKGITVPIGDSELTLPAFGVILKWLESSSAANILSTPHILTSDNEEASIEVGQKIPFRRGTALPAIPGAQGANLSQFSNLFSSTDRIDVSLKLTLTPHVNERNKVRLEIDEQIEDVVGIDEATSQPITANRSAKTVVVIDDQQTVIIGGLMRDRITKGNSKIPLLGDLPLIGQLFRDEKTDVEKVNLLLILTPYIVEDQDDFQRIFERKLTEYEDFAEAYYGHLASYRAHIDYARKSGPLARLSATVHTELARPENGGAGVAETIVSPDQEAPKAIVAPQLGGDADGGEDGGDAKSNPETEAADPEAPVDSLEPAAPAEAPGGAEAPEVLPDVETAPVTGEDAAE